MVRKSLILGIGNSLFGDEGFGVETLRRFQERLNDATSDVDFFNGDGDRDDLFPYLKDRKHLLVVDAVNFGGQPGEVIRLTSEDLRNNEGLNLNEHQVALQDMLAMLRKMGSEPEDVVVLGVQPKQVMFAEPLSQEVAAAMPTVVRAMELEVQHWKMGMGREIETATSARVVCAA